MNDEMFVLIEASKLSMDDEFMQHQPKTTKEQMLKSLLKYVIKKEIEDFWLPKMDPSLDRADNIYFKAGEQPAVGKSYNWWFENAKKFNSKRKSRLGTMSEYIAFLGVLIRSFIAEGWSADEAWDAVCNDAKKLVHYCDSQNAKYVLEPTGSRAIAGFYDLSNTNKILTEDEEFGRFWLAGGYFYSSSDYGPLNVLLLNGYSDYHLYHSVGWIVLEC